ncbi:DEAD/DEAH box helicase [Oleiharenicola lentus]|uniref:DEAD/DEAH box helicase n=1 Tax=Oleiharenicola lentus TaxID=2508720 RepID=UPI003F66E845
MEKRPFSELGLSPEILKAVDKMGFEEASPIQTAVIPFGLAGRDLVGQSATGSGKTAAFAIPAIERVDTHLKKVQVLVLCPTRELAVQVAEEFGKLAFFKKGLMEVPIYGGQSYERQFRALDAGAQVVIGTPGRVMDHMERGSLRLDALKMIVLDEADRMLDMGFREDIEHILKSVPAERQCLFFSATMPRVIQELIKKFTRNPEWVRIEASAQNAPQVEQIYYEVDRRSKIEVLTRLIDLHDFRFGIIFCSTKIMVDELDEHLHARGYAVDRLHGDITQATRTRVMDKFRRRGFEFLIATDVAARGLDVDDLEVVFNFDLPNDAEDYTHRIGRTGRAGRKGKAFTFVSGRELYKLQNMVHYGRIKIRRERVPSLDEVEQAKGNVFVEKLRTTLEEKKFKPQDQVLDRLMEQGHTSTDIASALIYMMQSDAAAESPKSPAKKIGGASTAAPAAPTAGPVRSEFPAPAPIKAAAAPKPSAFPATAKPAASTAPAYIAPEREYVPEKRAPREPAPSGDKFAAQKRTYERKARTGREPGFSTVSFNVGRAHLVTPADLVGKIAGVTRLPANIVGAIDIHEDQTHVDVLSEHAELVVTKLAGIRIKNQSLKPSIVPPSA